ncbi:MAG: ABC transporter permease [Desulfobacterales bacterium]|nr:ABC transporter permease [Desulfobacterales bacterium]
MTKFIQELLNITFLYYVSVRMLFQFKRSGMRIFIQTILTQLYGIGVRSVPVVSIIGILAGIIFITLFIGIFGEITGVKSIGEVVAVIILREISPLVTGFIMIMRSVTAITTQLGIMRIQREIEAMEVMGISPIRYLVTPRMVGGVASLYCLNVVFNIMAFTSGYIASYFIISLPFEVFSSSVFSAFSILDIIAYNVKIFVGGTVIILMACYYGLSVSASSTEIPRAVSQAAVSTLLFLSIFYSIVFFFTLIINEMLVSVD